MKKILAIASVGGHWIQLLRLYPAFVDQEIVFVSTHKKLKSTVPDNHKFYSVIDANRWNKINLIWCFCMTFKIVITERPAAIITTGAAPGLMGIILGRLIGAKTIWVDSIANVDELSLSGKIALKFAHRVYTQWPELANSKIFYSGNVLSA